MDCPEPDCGGTIDVIEQTDEHGRPITSYGRCQTCRARVEFGQ